MTLFRLASPRLGPDGIWTCSVASTSGKPAGGTASGVTAEAARLSAMGIVQELLAWRARKTANG